MMNAEDTTRRKILTAIWQKAGLSFQYRRPDGRITSHNAVYPSEILDKEGQVFFRAYCYFTRDVRLFRLDRVRQLRLKPSALSQRLRRREWTSAIILLLGILFFAVWTFTGGNPRGEWVLVTHVTDGDTIGIGRGWRYEKVRFIGIDTPETVHPRKPVEFFGPESSAFTKKQLFGKRVHLEFESGKQYGIYGRLLAYVFLENGTFFNEELVKQGYARVYRKYAFRYKKEFLRHERKAKKARRGLWNKP